MRCLYCGKELALFKRLRGGEFCSDAHRQRYHEEYTQLALNRLLQANAGKEKEGEKEPAPKAGRSAEQPARSPELAAPPVKGRERTARETAPAASAPSAATAPAEPVRKQNSVLEAVSASPAVSTASVATKPAPVQAPAPAPSGGPDPSISPTASPSASAPAAAPEEPPPAGLWGFLVELPESVAVEAEPLLEVAELPSDLPVVRPRLDEAAPPTADCRLAKADGVELVLFSAADFQTPPEEGGLELREFVRGVPPVEIILKPAVESGFEPVQEQCGVLFDATQPSGSPSLWLAPEAAFQSLIRNPEVELGDLARLNFALTEWGESAGAGDEPASPAPAVRPPRLEPLQRVEPAQHQAPVRESPEPVRFEPVRVNPIFVEKIAGSPALKTQPAENSAAHAEKTAEEPASRPEPESISKPMPVTLHGLAPARGKPVQVFSSAVLRTGNPQIPQETGLPLRPVMLLAPAPKPPAGAAAAETAKAIRIPEKRDAGPQGKQRRPDVRVLPAGGRDKLKSEPARPAPLRPEPPRPEPAKPEPVRAKPEMEKPAPQKVETAKPVVPAKPPIPAKPPAEAPVAAKAAPAPAATPEPDLFGLPTLGVGQPSNFWARLPGVARLAVIAGALAAAIGAVVLVSRGSGSTKAATPASTEPVMVEGPAIANAAGWAQDWFADRSGSKLGRHVDVLRGSLTLRDYRLLFEGTIEQGALGWVFRANEKNFYVEKIQIVTPGLNPAVALVRFPVINGKEQARTSVPLPIQAHLDTTYKVRVDVIGDRFTTWVQDQKVDQWTDSQIEAGGVGLYYENSDSAKLKDTLNVIPLTRK